MTTAAQVLDFWFEVLEPRDWFRKSDALDQRIAADFGETYTAAAAGELWHWRGNDQGRLAEIIVLDQFSRNIFRDQAQAFAADGVALTLAQEAVRQGVDQRLQSPQLSFLLMPYMHSESAAVHLEAERLFNRPELEGNHDFELRHKAIIDRFGRYPHRNSVLGRSSTDEELRFLAEPGSSF